MIFLNTMSTFYYKKNLNFLPVSLSPTVNDFILPWYTICQSQSPSKLYFWSHLFLFFENYIKSVCGRCERLVPDEELDPARQKQWCHFSLKLIQADLQMKRLSCINASQKLCRAPCSQMELNCWEKSNNQIYVSPVLLFA